MDRMILAFILPMAFAFKVLDINATAGFISSAGFPFATLLAILAALFDLAIILSFFNARLTKMPKHQPNCLGPCRDSRAIRCQSGKA